MSNRLIASFAALALAATLAACGGDDDGDEASETSATTGATETTEASAAATELAIDGVWARTSPMVATRGAVYMEITNDTGEDDALVDASVPTDVAARAELHETTTDTGAGGGTGSTMGAPQGSMGAPGSTMPGDPAELMGMREVDEIAVPDGETTALAPGGYHVMLIDLVAPLEAGTSIDVTLEFERAGTVTVEAEVRDQAP